MNTCNNISIILYSFWSTQDSSVPFVLDLTWISEFQQNSLYNEIKECMQCTYCLFEMPRLWNLYYNGYVKDIISQCKIEISKIEILLWNYTSKITIEMHTLASSSVTPSLSQCQKWNSKLKRFSKIMFLCRHYYCPCIIQRQWNKSQQVSCNKSHTKSQIIYNNKQHWLLKKAFV